MTERRLLPILLIAGLTGPVSLQSSPNEQAAQSVVQRQPLSAAACEGLASLTLPGATITLARAFDAGALTSATPAGGEGPAFPASQAATLPAFCRVAATLRPSSDSDIKIEVWMPAVNWNGLGWTASARATGLDHFRFLVFRDPNWDVQKFDFDFAIAEERDNDTINAIDPNLKEYIDRGGKLIQYHGWSDPQISPGNSTQYHARVLEVLGDAAKVHGSYRLFMAPGMAHCGGGEGPNTFDMVTALEQWVEYGKPPDRIIASHSTNGIVDRTRPLCPYLQVAAYDGKGLTGSPDEAASFVCRAQ